MAIKAEIEEIKGIKAEYIGLVNAGEKKSVGVEIELFSPGIFKKLITIR